MDSTFAAHEVRPRLTLLLHFIPESALDIVPRSAFFDADLPAFRPKMNFIASISAIIAASALTVSTISARRAPCGDTAPTTPAWCTPPSGRSTGRPAVVCASPHRHQDRGQGLQGQEEPA
ncbi:hypothetical protein ON010_g8357 [Phytophthora cinnamomi]|nr:hypothetical protein ON010_g8357 [Phytophthora cinnamomi]